MIRMVNQKQIWSLLVTGALFLGAGEALAVEAGATGAGAAKFTLQVQTKTKKTKDSVDDVKQDNNGNDRTTTTKTQTETVTLNVNVKRSGDPLSSCKLVWCFFSNKTKSLKDKGTLEIFSAGSKDLPMDSASLDEAIVSQPFIITRIASDSANSDDKESGDEYKGYLVLVTQNGQVLCSKANTTKYLADEWVQKCISGR